VDPVLSFDFIVLISSSFSGAYFDPFESGMAGWYLRASVLRMQGNTVAQYLAMALDN
jgi:hypothetical protein